MITISLRLSVGKCGNETLLYVSEKHRSIDGPFEHEGGDHRAMPQPGHERDCFPLSVPRVADQPLSTQGATSQPHHAGGRAGLVDKDESGRVKHALLSHPTPARAGHFRALLLCCVQSFF